MLRFVAASGALLLGIALHSAPAFGEAPATQPAQAAAFRVFDALAFTGTPHASLAELGMERIYVTGTDFWKGRYPNYYRTEPYEPACRFIARKVSRLNQVLVIDIEHWPVDIRKAPKHEVAANLAKLAKIADWIHDERPDVKLGFYGILPLQDYWTPVQFLTARERREEPWHRANLPKFEAAHQQWLQANEFVGEALASKVDYVFPSIYTFYEDRDGWLKFARASIDAARKYEKPVFPFLWMEFHDSNRDLKGTFLPGQYWSLQLNTCQELADGVVIWGGWKRRWDSQAAWWRETQRFLVNTIPKSK